jgi:DNA-binding transcriptional MerR regulator
MAKKRARVRQRIFTPASGSLAISSPDAPTITVGQIVKELESFAPNAAAMNERVRHWTKIGLLQPTRQRHSGTGRYRRYNPDVTFEAAVLSALASVGLELVSKRYVHVALSRVREALQKWLQARDLGQDLPVFFLVISHDVRSASAEPTVSIFESAIKPDPEAEMMIVIDLSRLFSRVRRTRTEHSDDDQDSGPAQRS